jgi:hypothetical protein
MIWSWGARDTCAFICTTGREFEAHGVPMITIFKLAFPSKAALRLVILVAT